VDVTAAGVALPDLDLGAGDRAAVQAEHAAHDMGDRAFRPRGAAAQQDEVVVDVGRKFLRIERPGGRARRRHEPGVLRRQQFRQDDPAGRHKAADEKAPAAHGRSGDERHAFRLPR
jgi:hypothetical protein